MIREADASKGRIKRRRKIRRTEKTEEKENAETGVKMGINPDLIDLLSNEKAKLWCAAHEDGSKNRIHGETVAEAATYSFSFAFLLAGLMGIRKKIRNRGKTEKDFEADKENSVLLRRGRGSRSGFPAEFRPVG